MSYGLAIRRGEAIAPPRLAADPAMAICVGCLTGG
jgi:RNA polymerase-binding transcription factor DksA